MICASLNRCFTSDLPSRELGLGCYSIRGGRRWLFAFLLALLFFVSWSAERRADRRFRELQFERDERRAREEADRKKKEAEAAREELDIRIT